MRIHVITTDRGHDTTCRRPRVHRNWRLAFQLMDRPLVHKRDGEWVSSCWHGNTYDHARFNTWSRAYLYALQHVEDAHACVSTP